MRLLVPELEDGSGSSMEYNEVYHHFFCFFPWFTQGVRYRHILIDIFLQLSHNKINVGQREGVLVTSDQMTLIYYPDAPETCFAAATHKAAVNKKVNVLVCYTIFPLCGFHRVTYKK